MLVEERKSWQKDFEEGRLPYYLTRYKLEVRNNDLARFSRELEKVCEYACWLEEKLNEPSREIQLSPLANRE
jgi:hypothetical protein